MSEHAPDLGEPTDIEETEATLDVDLTGEPTIETPDELGGTGGQQPGGGRLSLSRRTEPRQPSTTSAPRRAPPPAR